MSPIAQRKRQLIAESDLNRTRIAIDVGTSIAQTRASLGRIAGISTLLAAGAAAIGMLKPEPGRRTRTGRSASWISLTCDGVTLLAGVWAALRARRGSSASTNTTT